MAVYLMVSRCPTGFKEMKAVARAQPNIALIKYWGKRDVDRNLPAVSSISVTLDSLWTQTSVEFSAGAANDTLTINSVVAEESLPRVSRCLDEIAGSDRQAAVVVSESNFPLGAGLASSASGFAALVLAADAASGRRRDTLSLARLAGGASGSAARSLYGGFVELTAGERDVDLEVLREPDEWPLHVVAAITDEAAKPIGSGQAMKRAADTSPFYGTWLSRQDEDIAEARQAVESRDFARLAAVSEHNCLKMHSVMWTSRPPVVYWNKATLACLDTVRDLQAQGHGVFFTIDAGPQVKAVCLPDALQVVEAALRDTPGVLRLLPSALGHGAQLLENSCAQ